MWATHTALAQRPTGASTHQHPTTHVFRGAGLPLRGFLGLCLAAAALGGSHTGGGLLGASATSGFWFGNGTRGLLLVSRSFCSSDFMVLRIPFAVFLFSGTDEKDQGCRLPFLLTLGLHLEVCSPLALEPASSFSLLSSPLFYSPFLSFAFQTLAHSAESHSQGS